MAHGDYKCCAVCNVKQEYIGLNDVFKDDICEYCSEDTGLSTVRQLIKKINSFKTKKQLKDYIKEIKLRECYYQNDVDDLISFKLKGTAPKKFKSATEFLKGIGAL